MRKKNSQEFPQRYLARWKRLSELQSYIYQPYMYKYHVSNIQHIITPSSQKRLAQICV